MSILKWPIFKSFLSIASADLVSRIVRFIYLIFLARSLDETEVGLFSYGMAFYFPLIVLGVFGQGPLLASRAGRKGNLPTFVVASSRILIFASLGLSAIVGLAILYATESDLHVRLVLIIFVLAMVARGYDSWVRLVFIAREQATWIPQYELAFRIAEAIAGILALLAGGGLYAVCLVHLTFWILQAVASHRRLRQAIRAFSPHRVLLAKKYAAFSLPVLTGAFLQSLFPQTGIIVLHQMNQGAATVAFFSIPMQIISALFVLPLAAGQAILPGLARVRRTGNARDIQALLFVLKACLVGGAMCAAASTVLSPILLPAIFGATYISSSGALTILLWGLGPYSALSIVCAALNGFGKNRSVVIAAVVAIAIQISGTTLLIGPGSISALNAAGYSFVLATVVSLAYGLTSLTQVLSLHRHAMPRSWWFRAMLLFAISGCLALSGWQEPLWVSLFGPPIIATACFVLGVFPLREFALVAGKFGTRSQPLQRSSSAREEQSNAHGDATEFAAPSQPRDANAPIAKSNEG